MWLVQPRSRWQAGYSQWGRRLEGWLGPASGSAQLVMEACRRAVPPVSPVMHCYPFLVLELLKDRRWAAHTVIRFVSTGAKFGICTVVSVNEALVNAKMCTFTFDSTHFMFNKCPIYTHDGTSAKFSTSWDETDYSVGCSPAILWLFNLVVCIVNVFNRSSSLK
jgi:hypothetical protein